MAYRYSRAFGIAARANMSSNAASSVRTRSPFVSQIEVERKFLPTTHLSCRLDIFPDNVQHTHGVSYPDNIHEVGGDLQQLLHFTRLPDQVIHDTYYDLDGQLSKYGIWVRCREACTSPSHRRSPSGTMKLEAKVRLGGNYTNSQFHEIEGEPKVRSMLEEEFHGLSLDDLSVMAQLESCRKSWKVHEPEKIFERDRNTESCRLADISIVLDNVTAPSEQENAAERFKHQVGEIEMTREISGGADQQEHENMRREAAKQLDLLLQNFMLRHVYLFQTSPKPKGKLSAYLERKTNCSGADRDVV